MKDYYYILGIRDNASTEEIKKAFKKLATKFHPDKNEGDEFFANRFKEILEAFETLGNSDRKNKYDRDILLKREIKFGINFVPEIEIFRSTKLSFVFDEEITFTWKTINSDKVTLMPFGLVNPIDQITYKMHDFQNKELIFKLVAENTNIGRQTESIIKLENRTYLDLYNKIQKDIFKDDHKEDDKKTDKEVYASGDDKIDKKDMPSRIIPDTLAIIFLLFAVFGIIGWLNKIFG